MDVFTIIVICICCFCVCETIGCLVVYGLKKRKIKKLREQQAKKNNYILKK